MMEEFDIVHVKRKDSYPSMGFGDVEERVGLLFLETRENEDKQLLELDFDVSRRTHSHLDEMFGNASSLSIKEHINHAIS